METIKRAPARPGLRFTENDPLFRDPASQEIFNHNGYVVIDFLNPGEVATLIQGYTGLQGDLGSPAFASTIMSRNADYRLSVSATIARSFARAIDETFRNTRFFWGNFNLKFPSGKGGIVPLHQDPSFLDERHACALGIWVPLIDTTANNGALQVIPGSHTILTQPRCGGRPFPYHSLQDPLLKKFSRSLPMRAGQAYIGHPSLFHASPPNTSSEPRIVAAGLAGPADSTLRYFDYQQREGPGIAEMFEVDASYYLTAPLFSRPDPQRYRILETIPLDEPIPAADLLFEVLGSFNSL